MTNKKERKKSLTIRLPPSVRQRIESSLEDSGIKSISEFLRLAAEYKLQQDNL